MESSYRQASRTCLITGTKIISPATIGSVDQMLHLDRACPELAGESLSGFQRQADLRTTLTDRSSAFLTGGPASAAFEPQSATPSFETKSGTVRLVGITHQKSG